MLWFEYDGRRDAKVTNKHAELVHIRENMPPATSYYHDDDGFTVVIWDTRAEVIETYVFDNGRPTVWYFSAKNTAMDAWWRKIFTVGGEYGRCGQVDSQTRQAPREGREK